ncbi:hypothetical protein D9758_009613 [Tetrapyrgos nigripes]|uniref:Uncharacterized protein n=1 Tax=Tetrapyrgos nigripes TaxID=182062 RepID=A0A8H5GCX6_9AGAR|nr:hypothetical protein D9758_009613 [Tetrapyrgos nigripes]
MSHVFSLEDLARCEVSLDFPNEDQPPVVQWNSLLHPVDMQSSPLALYPLSIRANISFVDGKPSLKLVLCHDNIPSVPVALRDQSKPNEEISLLNGLDVLFPFSAGQVIPTDDGFSSSNSSPTSSVGQIYPINNIEGLDYLGSSEARNISTSSSLSQSPNSSQAPGLNPTACFDMGFDPFFSQPTWGNWSATSSPEPGLPSSREILRNRRRSSPDTTVPGYFGTCGMHRPTSKKKRVKCSICDETFSRRHDMMRHEAWRMFYPAAAYNPPPTLPCSI